MDNTTTMVLIRIYTVIRLFLTKREHCKILRLDISCSLYKFKFFSRICIQYANITLNIFYS